MTDHSPPSDATPVPPPLPPDLPDNADSLNLPAEAEIPFVTLTAVLKSQPVRATLIALPPALQVARRKPGSTLPAPKIPPSSFIAIGPLLIALIAYACMMAVSFGQATFAVLHAQDVNLFTDAQNRKQLVFDGVIFEGLDTLIVCSALLLAGRPIAHNAAAHRLLTWVCSVPGFCVLLGINLGYHFALQALVKKDPNEIREVIELALKDGWWAILLVCVQPAVVEELFFRYIFLGQIRPHLGMHAAVWLTAILFGMAHLGNIIGWPVLILVGAGLGYARVYSGGLTLPIILHFCHNYAVLLIDDAVNR